MSEVAASTAGELSQPGAEAERTITTELPGHGPGRDPRRRRAARRNARPFDRRNPFVVGFVGAAGALVAVALGATIFSVRNTLVLVSWLCSLLSGSNPWWRL
jgi:hypothetical protein